MRSRASIVQVSRRCALPGQAASSRGSRTITACTARRCSSNTTTRRTTPITSTRCIAISNVTSVATHCARTIAGNRLTPTSRSHHMGKKNAAAASTSAPLIDIGIKGKDREKIVEGLSRVLADTYTLYLKTHNFHWNVEGPMFNTLHLMFMDQYTELWNALDAVAERIRSLGFPAPGTGKEFANLTSIEETDGVPEALDMVRLLVAGHEAV